MPFGGMNVFDDTTLIGTEEIMDFTGKGNVLQFKNN